MIEITIYKDHGPPQTITGQYADAGVNGIKFRLHNIDGHLMVDLLPGVDGRQNRLVASVGHVHGTLTLISIPPQW